MGCGKEGSASHIDDEPMDQGLHCLVISRARSIPVARPAHPAETKVRNRPDVPEACYRDLSTKYSIS